MAIQAPSPRGHRATEKNYLPHELKDVPLCLAHCPSPSAERPLVGFFELLQPLDSVVILLLGPWDGKRATHGHSC